MCKAMSSRVNSSGEDKHGEDVSRSKHQFETLLGPRDQGDHTSEISDDL